MPGIFGIFGNTAEADSFESHHLFLDTYSSQSIKVNDHTFLGQFDFSSNNNSIYVQDHFVIVSQGEFYTDSEPVSSSNEKIFYLYNQYGLDFVNKIDGIYNICIYDKLKDKLILINDWAGNNNLFYYHKNGQFIFSTELKTIAKICEYKSINKRAIVEQCMFSHLLFQNTLINEIQLIEPSYIIELDNNQVKKKQYYDLKDVYNVEQAEDESYYIDKLYHLFEKPTLKYRQKRNLSLPLTGGMDSRFLLYFLLKYEFDLMDIFTGGPADSEDVIIAKQICRSLGLTHRKTNMPVQYFKEKFYDNYRIQEGFLPTIYYGSGLDELRSCGADYIIQYPSINMTLGDLYTPNTKNFIGDYRLDTNIKEKIFNKFLKTPQEIIESLFTAEYHHYNLIKNSVFEYFEEQASFPSLFVFDYFAWYQHCRRWSNIGGINGKFIGRIAPSQDRELTKFCFNLPTKYKYWQYLHKRMFKTKCPEFAKFPREGTGVPISWPEWLQMIFKAYRKGRNKVLLQKHVPDQFAIFFRDIVKDEINSIINSKEFKTRNVFNHDFVEKIWHKHQKGENHTFLMHNILNIELFFRNYLD